MELYNNNIGRNRNYTIINIHIYNTWMNKRIQNYKDMFILGWTNRYMYM